MGKRGHLYTRVSIYGSHHILCIHTDCYDVKDDYQWILSSGQQRFRESPLSH